ILSLAGIGTTDTEVEIVASPTRKENEHTIEVSGDFGDMKRTITNQPMPQNENTSYLAALSVLGTILRKANQTNSGVYKINLKISFQSNFKSDLFIIYYLFFKAALIDIVITKCIPSCHVTNWREASLLSSKVLLISPTYSASSFK